MKRLLKFVAIFTFCLMLIFVCLPFSASAVSGRTTIVFSPNGKLSIGDTITVTVTFSADATVNAAAGTLVYSSDVLEFVSGNNANHGKKGYSRRNCYYFR